MRTTKSGTVREAKLVALIAKINNCHQECLKSLRASLAHARQTGNHLLEAKGLVGKMKGKWLEWVQEHCEFSVSQAQRYMRIADRYVELLKQTDDPHNLTMTEALRLLSPKKKGDKEGPEGTARRFTAFSQAEVQDRAREADQMSFTNDSREARFVEDKAKSVARQVLALARRSKIKDEQGRAVDAVQVAIALVQQVKKALNLSLIVKVGHPESVKNGHRPKAKSAANGHKPVNRLNGRAFATAK